MLNGRLYRAAFVPFALRVGSENRMQPRDWRWLRDLSRSDHPTRFSYRSSYQPQCTRGAAALLSGRSFRSAWGSCSCRGMPNCSPGHVRSPGWRRHNGWRDKGLRRTERSPSIYEMMSRNRHGSDTEWITS